MSKKPFKPLSIPTKLLLLVLCSFAAYEFGIFRANGEIFASDHEIPQLKKQVNQLQKENAKLERDLIFAERKYQVEGQAKKNLGSYIKSLQEKNAELSQNMLLYQNVVGRAPINQGVQLKMFQVFTTSDPQAYRYSVLLVKKASHQEKIQGAVSMVIVGKIEDKIHLLPVKYVDSGRDDGLAFDFRHFQALEGELILPANFKADEVIFDIKPDNGWPTFQQRFPWQVAG
ncbi:MAG: DUF6776 family protein [Candidatus Berkiellales bacterium]